jgi:epoxyqueuosine reductase
MKTGNHKIEQTIIAKVKELGGSLAGIASVADLKASPSLALYSNSPYYEQFDPESPDYFKFTGFNWDEAYQSILVWGLEHPVAEPVMDWWSLKVPGFTPGNRILRAQSKKLRIWLGEELGLKAFSLPYQIEFGGIFLKDSAVLAGLGVIGKNNLLITPEFGPRVRLRGIFIADKLEPTGPINFDPCNGCPMPCHQACPQDAFRSGAFGRDFCKIENDKRYANEELLDGEIMGIDEPSMVMKPCRFCELACPVGQGVMP